MTTNERTLQKLRDDGFTVHVQQYRLPIESESLCLAYPEEAKAGDLSFPKYELHQRGQRPSGKGGKTVVTLAVEDGDETLVVTGIALCNIKDNFSKSTGLSIALGRALKELSA